ncbi:hypothetical protein [Streptomyces griseus]|uniref:hypothetical protein n=1 Tax=Streptomyces griseus TaxID=1911 RepID=UPI00363A35BF
MTELPGHEFGASGGLVSMPGDLNAFWDGLFGGRLLPGWAVRLMTRDTTDIGGRASGGRGTVTVYTTTWTAEGDARGR